MSLIIKGPLLSAGKLIDGAIRIDNGIITEVATSGDLGPAAQVITLGPRQTLLPAGIDTLVALRDWGEALRDTVECATKAALAGGVTVVCDQANTVPRLNTPELVHKRTEYVAGQSYTDFGVSAHPPVQPERLNEYREAGAFCVNLFMWDLRPWNYPRDIDDSTAQFARFAEQGLKGLVYTDELAFRQTSLEEHGELYALEALLRRLHPDFQVRIAITLPECVDHVLKVKERLPNALIQTAQHALFMSHEEGYKRIGIAAAHTPPLRATAEVARLRGYADEGKLDVYVSHHAPHPVSEKYRTDPFPGEFTPKMGYSALDFAYPLFLSKLGFAETCRGFCEIPARHLGLRKGLIMRGYEADLVIVEENTPSATDTVTHVTGMRLDPWRIDPVNFYSKGKVTPFVGERLKYRVMKTFLRGEEAYDATTGTFRRLPVKRVQ